jgi:hypothetical protein
LATNIGLFVFANLNASNLPNFSGNWTDTSNAGGFQLNLNNSATDTNSYIGSHLMFMIQFYIMFVAMALAKT